MRVCCEERSSCFNANVASRSTRQCPKRQNSIISLTRVSPHDFSIKPAFNAMLVARKHAHSTTSSCTPMPGSKGLHNIAINNPTAVMNLTYGEPSVIPACPKYAMPFLRLIEYHLDDFDSPRASITVQVIPHVSVGVRSTRCCIDMADVRSGSERYLPGVERRHLAYQTYVGQSVAVGTVGTVDIAHKTIMP